MRRLSFLFLLLLSLLPSLSWGKCQVINVGTRYSSSGYSGSLTNCETTTSSPGLSGELCSYGGNYISCYISTCGGYNDRVCVGWNAAAWQYWSQQYYFDNSYSKITGSCSVGKSNDAFSFSFGSIVGCDTQAEADSVACVQGGKQWVSGPNGGCQEAGPGDADCAAAKAGCEALGGNPIYTVSVDKQTCTGACDLCGKNADGTYKNADQQANYERLKGQCCGSGGSFTGQCVVLSAGQSVYANGSQLNTSQFTRGCDFNVAVDVVTGYVPGCEDIDDPSMSSSSVPGGGEGSSSSGSGDDDYHGELAEIISLLEGIEYIESNIAANTETMAEDLDSLVTYADSTVSILSDIRTAIQDGGLGGDTVIVNVAGDTNIINVESPDINFNPDINVDLGDALTDLGKLDGISESNDSIASHTGSISGTLDSMLSIYRDSSRACNTTECLDSFGSGWVGGIDSALGDTTGFDYGGMADSILNGWGDSTGHGDGVGDTSVAWVGLEGYSDDGCAPDDTSCHSQEWYDQYYMKYADSLKGMTVAKRDSLPGLLDSYYDTLQNYNLTKKWSNQFYLAMNSRVPDIDRCPDQCFGSVVDWSVEMPGNIAVTLDNLDLRMKVCEPMPGMSISVMNFLKFLFRLLTTVTCLSLVLWEVSTKRGTIGF